MRFIRPPAVAGSFYPADPRVLRQAVQDFLFTAEDENQTMLSPKAIIVPHAGYIYSGPIAASAYKLLQSRRQAIREVVLLGPSHRVGFQGMALSSAAAFSTPLGDVPIEHGHDQQLLDLPGVAVMDEAHRMEHSLEVHLPFLQVVLDAFKLLPIVVGDASPAQVANVLESLWGHEETLIVISSDLSHYHDYGVAQHMDHATSVAIQELRYEDLGYEDACGRNPIGGLLYYSRQHDLHGQVIDVRNSGDTAGPRDRVVGYGAYAFQ